MNYKGGKKEIICQSCGKAFFVFPYRAKKAKFCSFKCHGKFSGSTLDRTKIKYRCGKDHPGYRGGWICKGYRLIRINGKYVREHRHVMEKFLGRKLKKSETVHHINHNRLDNKLKNLELLTRSEHTHKYHIKGVNF